MSRRIRPSIEDDLVCGWWCKIVIIIIVRETLAGVLLVTINIQLFKPCDKGVEDTRPPLKCCENGDVRRISSPIAGK